MKTKHLVLLALCGLVLSVGLSLGVTALGAYVVKAVWSAP